MDAGGGALRFRRARIHVVHLPYRAPVTWAGHAETGLDAVLLELETEDGLCGIGEGVARVNWAGVTPRSLITTLEEVFLPRLAGADLADETLVARILGRIPEHALAKAMIDTAVCDLRAQLAAVPLWAQLGASPAADGGPPLVPLTFTLTRSPPAEMAAEAARVARDHGLGAFKVKTGQGLSTDRAVLAAVRDAVGENAFLFADANRAYGKDELESYTGMLAEFGAAFAEDPCELRPDAEFAELLDRSAVPLLVDHACRDFSSADLFVAAGAPALSIKVPKSGLTQSLRIARRAASAGARGHVGIGAVSGPGAQAALALAAALPDAASQIPCEEAFFLSLDADILKTPLSVSGGTVRLPAEAGLHGLIDWAAVRSRSSG